MNEDDKVLLYELNETYTDGFVRGYNRGFLDGIYMLTNIYEDKELLKKIIEYIRRAIILHKRQWSRMWSY